MGSYPKSPFAGRQWSGRIREINFNNYVGLARIGPLQVHVENRKLGDDLFHALLDNVADHYADLISDSPRTPWATVSSAEVPPGGTSPMSNTCFCGGIS